MSAESLEALQSRQQWLQQDPSVPIFCFPYGIMEIKVESGSSGKKALMSTVGQLIKAGQLLEVSCFSKYQHAVATLLLPGRQGDHQAPRWFADACESCGNLRPKNFSELSAERRQSENGRKAGQVCDQKGGSGGVAAEVNSGGENAAPAVSATWSWRRPLLSLRPHARPAAEDQGWTLCHGKQARKTTKVRVEPRTFFSNERTFLSWVNIAVLLLFAGLALMDGSSFTGSGPGAPIRLAHPQPGIANPTPTAGASVGADDATLGAERAQVAAHRIPGMLIAPTAVVFMVYALFQYHYRASKLFSREYIRYDDIWGPTCLVIVLLVTSVTAFSLSLKGTTAF